MGSQPNPKILAESGLPGLSLFGCNRLVLSFKVSVIKCFAENETEIELKLCVLKVLSSVGGTF